jgi:hypothetical protein
MRIAGILVVMIVACEDPDSLPEGYEDLCVDGAVPWVKNVVGAPPYDSMEVRDARDATAGVKVLDKTGTPCAKATDKAACDAAYAAVDLKANGDVAFVGTRGNDVVVKNVNQLDTSVLGFIDNPYEAAVLAVGGRERAPLTCANDQIVGFKRNGTMYEIAAVIVDSCTGRRTRVITQVETTGATREIRSDSISAGEPKICD